MPQLGRVNSAERRAATPCSPYSGVALPDAYTSDSLLIMGMCSCVDGAGEVPRIGVATPTPSPEALVDADLDALVTALYVKIDDGLVKDRRPGHPVRLSQSELICLAVAQALLGFHSEHRWIRFALCHLRAMFPYLPHQPGYNKRLRAALPLVRQVIRDLAADSDCWSDDVQLADSTPVECGRSRPTARRSDMAGWANYGYSASHSRWSRCLSANRRWPDGRPARLWGRRPALRHCAAARSWVGLGGLEPPTSSLSGIIGHERYVLGSRSAGLSVCSRVP